MFKKNGSMSRMQPASTIIIIIPMIFGNHGVLQSIFLIDLELVVLVFSTFNISKQPHCESVEYGMLVYLMKIADPKFSFFSRLTKFQ